MVTIGREGGRAYLRKKRSLTPKKGKYIEGSAPTQEQGGREKQRRKRGTSSLPF